LQVVASGLEIPVDALARAIEPESKAAKAIVQRELRWWDLPNCATTAGLSDDWMDTPNAKFDGKTPRESMSECIEPSSSRRA
jgi:hypothetical protein